MRCPYCGSPVRIRGSQWECGWCGDCGFLRPAYTPPRDKLYLFGIFRMWHNLKTALAELTPEAYDALQPSLGKVLIHEISAGVSQQATAPEPKLGELIHFLQRTTDLHLTGTVRALIRDIRKGVLFRDEAELSPEVCGTFWTAVLAALPPERRRCAGPEGLLPLMDTLAATYGYFCGADRAATQARRAALLDAFSLHKRNDVLT